MLKKPHVVVVVVALLLIILYVFVVAISPTGFALPSENADNLPEKLVVDGLVSNPMTITYEELLAMPSAAVTAPLICVQNPTGGGVVPVEWTGVPLKAILENAEILQSVVKVAFHAEDCFSTDLTPEASMRDDILIADKENGETIRGLYNAGPPSLRLVVPQKWGYTWTVWLNHIQVVDFNFLGVWETNGYSDEADITP